MLLQQRSGQGIPGMDDSMNICLRLGPPWGGRRITEGVIEVNDLLEDLGEGLGVREMVVMKAGGPARGACNPSASLPLVQTSHM